jgi:small conductance mechanosensitive channel
MEEGVREAMVIITAYGLNVIGAIIILIVGRIIAGWAESAVDRWLKRSERFDETLRGFFAKAARYLVIIFTFLAVLSQFGIETTSIIAILGVAGLAIGLALQGTLSNVAAGVMLLIFRPFKTGDFVEAAGIAGTVKSITVFITELATPDNVQILAPNSQVWGATVRNYSFHPTRRVDLVMGIDYGDNIDSAMETVLGVVNADSRVLRDPEPMVVVGNLGESSVDLTIRVWCNADDYWPLKFDLTKALKQRFDQEGISIPFPQRTIHMVKEEAS